MPSDVPDRMFKGLYFLDLLNVGVIDNVFADPPVIKIATKLVLYYAKEIAVEAVKIITPVVKKRKQSTQVERFCLAMHNVMGDNYCTQIFLEICKNLYQKEAVFMLRNFCAGKEMKDDNYLAIIKEIFIKSKIDGPTFCVEDARSNDWETTISTASCRPCREQSSRGLKRFRVKENEIYKEPSIFETSRVSEPEAVTSEEHDEGPADQIGSSNSRPRVRNASHQLMIRNETLGESSLENNIDLFSTIHVPVDVDYMARINSRQGEPLGSLIANIRDLFSNKDLIAVSQEIPNDDVVWAEFDGFDNESDDSDDSVDWMSTSRSVGQSSLKFS